MVLRRLSVKFSILPPAISFHNLRHVIYLPAVLCIDPIKITLTTKINLSKELCTTFILPSLGATTDLQSKVSNGMFLVLFMQPKITFLLHLMSLDIALTIPFMFIHISSIPNRWLIKLFQLLTSFERG